MYLNIEQLESYVDSETKESWDLYAPPDELKLIDFEVDTIQEIVITDRKSGSKFSSQVALLKSIST